MKCSDYLEFKNQFDGFISCDSYNPTQFLM